MPIPEFEISGDLPAGVHRATLAEVIARFGSGSAQRQAVTERLLRIHGLVNGTGKLARFIVFGSYVTTKQDPNDVDVFIVMRSDFVMATDSGSAREVFEHAFSKQAFGASIFWATERIPEWMLDDLVVGWQTTRDKTIRGIVEVIA